MTEGEWNLKMIEEGSIDRNDDGEMKITATVVWRMRMMSLMMNAISK